MVREGWFETHQYPGGSGEGKACCPWHGDSFEVSYSAPYSSFLLPQIHKHIWCSVMETNLLSTTGHFISPTSPITPAGMKHKASSLYRKTHLSLKRFLHMDNHPDCWKYEPHFSSSSLPATTPLLYPYSTGHFPLPELLTLE